MSGGFDDGAREPDARPARAHNKNFFPYSEPIKPTYLSLSQTRCYPSSMITTRFDQRICPWCGTVFTPTNTRGRVPMYCSKNHTMYASTWARMGDYSFDRPPRTSMLWPAPLERPIQGRILFVATGSDFNCTTIGVKDYLDRSFLIQRSRQKDGSYVDEIICHTGKLSDTLA
jgi:hypothetical protein